VQELHPADVVRFGPYEVRLRTQEVLKGERRLKLPPKAFQVLRVLLEANGQLVTREELHRALWSSDTFVDFDHGLNNAVKKLRDVLSDSAETPRYIETLPRLGYRFVAKVAEYPPAIELVPPIEPGHRPVRIKPVVWVVVGVVCLAAAFAGAPLRHRIVSPPLIPVPFTSFPGWETSPTFSPDGSQIAFSWSGDLSHYDLYTKVIDSEETLRLTTHPSLLISPAWSPDGRQIAFHRISAEETGLYVVSALGGPERKLKATSAVDWNTQISWSPDAKYIAYADFAAPDNQSRIFLLSPDTTESKPIPHLEECQAEFHPAFSTHSQKLAYGCYLRSGGFGLYSMVVPDGHARLIKTFSGFLNGIAWTGGGDRLVISRLENGKFDELIEVNASDGSFQKLAFGDNGCLPAISLKGDKLAYAAFSEHNVTIWRVDLKHPESGPAKFISSTRRDLTPRYAPDGKHIAFSSGRGGTYEVWISDENGMHPTQVSHLGNPATGAPVWSPDSKQIAFDSRRGNHSTIYVADTAVLSSHKLVTNLPDIAQPWWSRDGKWIYFLGGSDDTLGERIYRSPASGGDAVPVSTSRGVFPQEDPDGTGVYFCSNVGGAWRIIRITRQQGNSESLVAELPPLRFGDDWTVATNGIYFVASSTPTTIQYFDFATRKISALCKVANPFGLGMSVSPDGRFLLFTQVEPTGSDIMLVDHFH